MGTGSNNAENTTTAAAAGAQVATQITIQGQQFELRNLSVADAQRLYGLLSASDQTRVQGLAQFIQNFRAPLRSELPAELQQPGRIEAFMRHLQTNAGSVSDSAPQWMRKVYADATNQALNLPGAEHVRALIDTARDAGSLASGAAAAAGEARDWALLLPRATEFIITRAREEWGVNRTAPTAEQATAMATAYQGALVASRSEAGLLDKVTARGEQVLSWANNSAVGVYINAFFAAVGNLVTTGHWNFGEALAAAQAKRSEPRSYEQILNENLERPVQAAGALRNAERVAGRATEGVADTLEAASTTGSVLWVDQNNQINSLNASNQTAAVNGPDGAPLTTGDVNANRLNQVFGSIGQNGIVPAVGGAMAGAIIPGRYLLQGFMRGRVTNHERAADAIERRAEGLTHRIDAARNAGNHAEVDRLSAERTRLMNRWMDESETAESRRANAGRMTERALNQLDEAHPQRGPRLPGGRILQNLGEDIHNMLSGSRSAVAEAPHTASNAGAAARNVAAAAGEASVLSRVGGFLSQNSARLSRIPVVGRAFAVAGVAGLAATPAVAGISSMTADNATESNIRGTEAAVTGGLALSALRFGIGRAFAPIVPVMDTADLVSSASRHDTRGVVGSGTALGTVATFTAGGAALGLAGGPFAPISVPAGAFGGLVVGGIASIFTKWGAEAVYDRRHPQQPTQTASRDGAAGPADAGLQAAAVDQATAQSRARTAFSNVRDVHNGGNATLADAESSNVNRTRNSLPLVVSA